MRQPIIDGLTGVVNDADGTANGAFANYVGPPVIGKTGTAQITNGEDTSWFVGVTNPANDPRPGQAVRGAGDGGAGRLRRQRGRPDRAPGDRLPEQPHRRRRRPSPSAPASGNEQSF